MGQGELRVYQSTGKPARSISFARGKPCSIPVAGLIAAGNEENQEGEGGLCIKALYK